MLLSLTEYLELTKCLRMLYGTHVATKFFEQNFETFTGSPISKLNMLKKRDTLNSTLENKL